MFRVPSALLRSCRRNVAPRPHARSCRLSFETLEDRLTPSMSVNAEYMLQLIDSMRADPAATLPMLLNANDPNITNALSYFNVSVSVLKQQWATLTPVPPLTWNDALETSATGHSQLMLQDAQQSHQLPGEADPGTRMANAGYAPAGSFDWGENIYAYSPGVFDGFAAFAIDWGTTATGIQDPPGHRENMMDSLFQEIGVGYVTAPAGSAMGPLLITEDFGGGRSSFQPALLGAVYNDANNNGRYDRGEGLGDVTLNIVGSGGTFSVTTDSSGAYQIPLPADSYTVTATGGGLAGPIVKNVTIGTDNVLLNLTPGALVITTQPLGQIVPAGDQVTFTAAADGSPAPTVQWQVSANGGASFSDINGATATTLSFNAGLADNGKEYRAVFSNGTGSATTTAVTLTVRAAPAVLTDPLDQTANAGHTVTFAAQASGSPKPKVQWQVSSDGGNTFTNIPGATATSLSFTALGAQNGYQYRAVFTSILGTATTNPATLDVTCAPAITAQPAGQTVAVNATANFAAAVVANPAAAAQWQISTNGGASFTNIAGAASVTLSFNPALTDNGKLYRVSFTNNLGTVTSKAVLLTVDARSTILTEPKNQTLKAGQQATFTAGASGTPSATVQWQVSSDGGNSFRNIAGATYATLSFTAQGAQNGDEYRAVFTNGVCQVPTSAATLVVSSAPLITVQPLSQTILADGQATFTAGAQANPGLSGIQWQVSTNHGVTFNNIALATSNSLTIAAPSSDNGNEYRALFSNALGTTASRPAVLTIDVPLTITANPTSLTRNAGQEVTMTASAAGTAPTVQWQVSTDDGSTFSNIPGATSFTLSFIATPAENGNEYRAVFSNPVSQVATAAATLVADFAPIVSVQPVAETVALGNAATFTAAVNADPAISTVQWQVSANGGTSFHNISGATTPQLTFTPALSDNGNLYRVLFTNALGTTVSKPAVLHVGIPPVIRSNPADQSVQPGQRVTFTAAAMGTPTPQVQWQASTDGGASFTNIAGATSATFSFVAQAAQDGNEYRAVFTNSGGRMASAEAELGVS